MPKTPRSINFSFLFIILSLSIAPLFQNCSSQIDFGKTDNFALEQGYAELVDFYIDPNSWDAKPNINVVAIVDNSNSMSPIQEKVANGLEQSLDPLNQFAGRLELYTTTQGLDPVFTQRSEEDLKLSVVQTQEPYSVGTIQDPQEYVDVYRLPASFTKDSSGTRRALYYNPDNLTSVKQRFGQSIRDLGTLGSSEEQGICTLMRSIASQSEEEQTQYAFVLVSNEDDATNLDSCLEEVAHYKQYGDGTGFADCTTNDLGDANKSECKALNKINVSSIDYKTQILAQYPSSENYYATQSDPIKKHTASIKLKQSQYGYVQDNRTCKIQLEKVTEKKDLKLLSKIKQSRWKMQYPQNRFTLTAKRVGTYTYEGRNFSESFQENIGTVDAESCASIRKICNAADLALYNNGTYKINADGTLVDANLTNSCEVLCTSAGYEMRDFTNFQTVNYSCEQNFENNQLKPDHKISSVPSCNYPNCSFVCENRNSQDQNAYTLKTAVAGSCDGDNSVDLSSVMCGSESCKQYCDRENIECNDSISCSANNSTQVIAPSNTLKGEECSDSIAESTKTKYFDSASLSGCGSSYECNFSLVNRSGNANSFTAFSSNKSLGSCDQDIAESLFNENNINCEGCTAKCNDSTSGEYKFDEGYSLTHSCITDTDNRWKYSNHSNFSEFLSVLDLDDIKNQKIHFNSEEFEIGDIADEDIYVIKSQCYSATRNRYQKESGSIANISNLSSYSEVSCNSNHANLVSDANSWINSNTGSDRSLNSTNNITCYKYEKPITITTADNIKVDGWELGADLSSVEYPDNCLAMIPEKYKEHLNFPQDVGSPYCKLTRIDDSLSVSCEEREDMLRAGSTQQELENIAEAICEEDLDLSEADMVSYEGFSSEVVGSYSFNIPNGQYEIMTSTSKHLQSLDPADIKNAIQVKLGTLEGINFASFVTPPKTSAAFQKCEEEAASYNPEDPNYNPFAEGTLYTDLMDSLGQDKASTYSVCEENYVAAFQEIVDRVVAEAEFSYKISLAEYENVYKVFLVDQAGHENELKPYMYFVKAGLINIEPAYYHLLTDKISSIRVQIYRDLQAREELLRVPASEE